MQWEVKNTCCGDTNLTHGNISDGIGANEMIKIFLDSADLPRMVTIYKQNMAQGFTTNPTLMYNAGVKDYEPFARLTVREIPDLPISFEVLSNDLKETENQAKQIASWGKNVYVKIPIVTANNDSCLPLIKKLNRDGIRLNITAVYTIKQVITIREYINDFVPTIISVFAGRIADIGHNPEQIISFSAMALEDSSIELLWASCREVYNIKQAEQCGCDIITVPPTILEKVAGFGVPIEGMSLQTVKQFSLDATIAGYKL